MKGPGTIVRWCVRVLFVCLVLAAVTLTGGARQGRPAVLEYVAHASFVVESPSGVRVVIDPFNSERWLGYTFPPDLTADAVLVSHPHYDHDASYYFPSAPAFRRPGRYAVGDVVIDGHRGRHAGQYGMDFGQVNTLWVIETGGIRIAHLGDNGPLTEENLAALGRVDVLLAPMDDQDHILDRQALASLRARLSPRLVVPMHYQLGGFHDLPTSLGPPPAGVERFTGHRLPLDAAAFGPRDRTLLMRPSPAVRPWPAALVDAWRLRDASRKESASLARPGSDGLAPGLATMRQAAGLAPRVIAFQVELAELLQSAGRPAEAAAVLERAISQAAVQDVEYTLKGRMVLAGIYAAEGRADDAATQYRVVTRTSARPAQIEVATTFLRRHSGGFHE